MPTAQRSIEVAIIAIRETAGSALYGMVDVLLAAGTVWETLSGTGVPRALFRVRIVSPEDRPFTCGNGIPVIPHASISNDPSADLVILPEMWLGPDEHMHGRYPELLDWVRRRRDEGAAIFSACSGAVLLAETGLLDGREATSHWGLPGLVRPRIPLGSLPAGAKSGVRRRDGMHRDGRRYELLARPGSPHHCSLRRTGRGDAAGYEDASFFRRLFKRTVGLSPSQYRRMFQPVRHAAGA